MYRTSVFSSNTNNSQVARNIEPTGISCVITQLRINNIFRISQITYRNKRTARFINFIRKLIPDISCRRIHAIYKRSSTLFLRTINPAGNHQFFITTIGSSSPKNIRAFLQTRYIPSGSDLHICRRIIGTGFPQCPGHTDIRIGLELDTGLRFAKIHVD